MQVSSANSLTWLQSTAASASPMGPASSADGQDGSDATFDAIPNSLALSGLQSPSQMFSSASLNTLISAQTDQDSTGGPASTTGVARHHHHHGGRGAAEALEQTTTQAASSAAGDPAAASSTDAGAETQLAQLLMTV